MKSRAWATCRSSRPPATPDVGTAHQPLLALPVHRPAHRHLRLPGPPGLVRISAYLKLFAFIQDLEAAEMLSRSCGEFTAIGESSSEGTGQSNQPDRYGSSTSSHSSQSRNQLARRLIKPEEVLQQLRYDEQIVLVQNAPPTALRSGDLLPPPRHARTHQGWQRLHWHPAVIVSATAMQQASEQKKRTMKGRVPPLRLSLNPRKIVLS